MQTNIPEGKFFSISFSISILKCPPISYVTHPDPKFGLPSFMNPSKIRSIRLIRLIYL